MIRVEPRHVANLQAAHLQAYDLRTFDFIWLSVEFRI